MINPYAQSFMIAARQERRPEDKPRPVSMRPSRLRRFFSIGKAADRK